MPGWRALHAEGPPWETRQGGRLRAASAAFQGKPTACRAPQPGMRFFPETIGGDFFKQIQRKYRKNYKRGFSRLEYLTKAMALLLTE